MGYGTFRRRGFREAGGFSGICRDYGAGHDYLPRIYRRTGWTDHVAAGNTFE